MTHEQRSPISNSLSSEPDKQENLMTNGNSEILWHVYMVRCADGSLYTGIAKDADARVLKHNAGQGAKYTRAKRPVVLVYQETAEGHGAALRREAAIRRLQPEAKRLLAARFIESKSTIDKL